MAYFHCFLQLPPELVSRLDAGDPTALEDLRTATLAALDGPHQSALGPHLEAGLVTPGGLSKGRKYAARAGLPSLPVGSPYWKLAVERAFRALERDLVRALDSDAD